MRNPKGCWLECTAAVLAIFCSIGLNVNTFAVYIPYLTKLLALSPTQSSGFLMVRSLCSVCGVYLAKYYYDKLDIRVGYTLALLMSSVALLLYSQVAGFAQLCLAAAISGLSYGLGGMYPVAILIHRWFPYHEGLAMGICSASSGLALTITAPPITALIERFSIQVAMYAELGFFLLCAVICFILLKNYPDAPLHYTHRPKEVRHRLRLNIMFFALVAIGIMGGSFSFISVHYTKEGLDPYQVSTIISIIGVCLVGGKFLLGTLVDLWGGYRTNWLFLSLAIASFILFSLGNRAGYPIAITAGVLYGIGDSLATLGVTIYARDLSKPEEYAATQQQFQFAYMLGVTVCTMIPGLVATITGSYREFFLLVTLFIVFATVIIQRSYVKMQRR